MASSRRTWPGDTPADNKAAEEEPHLYLQLFGGGASAKQKSSKKGVVDMDADDFSGHPGGMAGGYSVRGYSGEPRWSGQSSSPSSPVSPTSTSRPPSYKSNPPVPPMTPSPVEDYTAPMPYNEYEELPNLRYNNPNYKYHEVSGVVPETRRPSPGAGSHLGPMTRSTENLCQMNNSIHDKPQLPSYRRRQNPLYEDKGHEDGKTGRATGVVSEMCILCLLLVVGILAVAALILVILDLSGAIGRRSYTDGPVTLPLITENGTDVVVMARRLQDLERRYSDLEKFVKDLPPSTVKDIVTQNQTQNYATLKLLLSQQDSNITRIENRMQQFRSDMMAFNTSVRQQLSEISKLPGPQGPTGPQGPKGDPGAGNLTRCRYRSLSHGSAIGTPSTDSPWTPDAQGLRDWVIMGLECSTTGGETAMLQKQPHPNNDKEKQFSCQCRGSSSSSSARYCYIHVFECPRIS